MAAGLGAFQQKAAAAPAKTRAAIRASAFSVMSAMGDIVIPVDEDPGYATFDPGITEYALDGFVQHFILAGNTVAYETLQGALDLMNEAPPLLDYGPRFLQMSAGLRQQYFTDCLTGAFENDGWGDILGLGAFLGLFAPKAVFFSNYPRHLARPGQDIQVLPASAIKTGWDINRFRGPIQAREEQELRDQYLGIEVLPGIERDNPYI
ncbi:MAG: hypothetical protein FJW39_30150 [Acidobacteria bacterium]|nr:hypothetical protein [Acidobacteriota bacterium]